MTPAQFQRLFDIEGPYRIVRILTAGWAWTPLAVPDVVIDVGAEPMLRFSYASRTIDAGEVRAAVELSKVIGIEILPLGDPADV